MSRSNQSREEKQYTNWSRAYLLSGFRPSVISQIRSCGSPAFLNLDTGYGEHTGPPGYQAPTLLSAQARIPSLLWGRSVLLPTMACLPFLNCAMRGLTFLPKSEAMPNTTRLFSWWIGRCVICTSEPRASFSSQETRQNRLPKWEETRAKWSGFRM